MARQEPARPSKVRAWQGRGNRGALRPPPASQPCSSKASSPSASLGRRSASQLAPTKVGAKGMTSTIFFRKTREMTSVQTSPGSQSSLQRAGALRNGLQDVEEARTSPLHHPESHRLATPFHKVCRKFGYHPSILIRQKHNFAEKSG